MTLSARSTTIPAPYVVSPSQSWDGVDGNWSTFTIAVGTPGQEFRILPSTFGGETWVIDRQGCTGKGDSSTCPESRGVQNFNGAASPGFQANQSSTWRDQGIYSLDWEEQLGYQGNGSYGYDTVRLGRASDTSAITLNQQTVASFAVKAFYLGFFGLGLRPTSFSSSSNPVAPCLQSIRNQNLIPSLSYGYTAGAHNGDKPVYGNLVLGGYDSSRMKSTSFSFPFSTDDARQLTVGIQSILASDSLKGKVSLTPPNTPHLSLIDSTVPHLWLPKEICDQFEANFGLTWEPQGQYYLVNDTAHSKLLQLNPTFTFKLGNTAYDTGNYTNIDVPYSAFDLWLTKGNPYDGTYRYFPIRRANTSDQYVIGRSFLQAAYLIVDYERRNFTVAQASFSDPMPSSQIITIQSTNTTSTNDGPNIGTGAIVGIAVGGAAVIIIAVIGLIYFLRRRSRAKKEKATELEAKEKEKASENGQSDHLLGQNDGKPVMLDSTAIQELDPTAASSASKWDKGAYARDAQSHLLNLPPQELPTPHGTPSVTPSSPQEDPIETQPVIYEMEGEYYVPVQPSPSVQSPISEDPAGKAPSSIVISPAEPISSSSSSRPGHSRESSGPSTTLDERSQSS